MHIIKAACIYIYIYSRLLVRLFYHCHRHHHRRRTPDNRMACFRPHLRLIPNREHFIKDVNVYVYIYMYTSVGLVNALLVFECAPGPSCSCLYFQFLRVFSAILQYILIIFYYNNTQTLVIIINTQ